MKFVKKIYDECWESEYDLYTDEDGNYCLVPNNNTQFHIKPLKDFKLEGDLYIYRLAWIGNHHKKSTDVLDIVSYNKVLCYVVAGDIPKRFCLLPAVGGSGMAVDNAYIKIGSWGSPDFIKIDCPCCQHSIYYNEQKISGAAYEIVCPKCSMQIKRKKNMVR